jgi:hypothetical protein
LDAICEIAYCSERSSPLWTRKRLKRKRFVRDESQKDQEADEEEKLQEADRHTGQRRAPGEWDAEGVDRVDGEEDQRGDAQERGDDRDEIGVEFEATEETPNDSALEEFGHDQPERHQPDKGRDPKDRDLVPGEIEERGAQPNEIH